LVRYETGDFLLLSDISDSIRTLRDFFVGDEVALGTIEWMLKCVRDEMNKSGDKLFVACLGERIEALRKLGGDLPKAERDALVARILTLKCKGGKGYCAVGEYPVPRDAEALSLFLAESEDRLSEAQSIILEMEGRPGAGDLVQRLFRVFHTIKGECGFLKIASLGELTHNLESLLDGMRSGKIAFDPSFIDIFLAGIDASRTILSRLRAGDTVLFNDVPIDGLLERIQKASRSTTLGDILVQEGRLDEGDVGKILQKQKESAYSKRFGEVAVGENLITQEELQAALDRQKQGGPALAPRAARSDPVIKVRAAKVNFLVDMIGELLIAMGQVNDSSPSFTQMRKIARTLQYGAMELRTETAQGLYGNVRRVVRDLSKQLGKEVRLETSGEDLEIDRSLIEKLEEPLVHMVRNSLDHGIEPPETRVAAGKPPVGTITLTSERRGNTIVLALRDDGHGLDRSHILKKAIDRGLVRRDSAETMSDAQVHGLIFEEGFSTNDTVTLVSGRGVGMGIVRQTVLENRGRIEILTEPGEFTEFRLVFPLSTAIIDGMIARLGKNMFVFPISSVYESLKVDPSRVASVNGNAEVYTLRGEIMPLVRMSSVLAMRGDEDGDGIGLVVECADGRRYVIAVDEVIAKREVVIKSLGQRFRGMRGVSSCTVLSGGAIGLVVDVDQLVAHGAGKVSG
jgi:two-component system chemotaxis sensor kinase CheA